MHERVRWQQTLRVMGLDDKAATIYLSLLGYPRRSISEISRETGIKRPTCYQHIEDLLRKGFVTREPSGKRIEYRANDPRAIFRDFKRQIVRTEGAILEMEGVHDQRIHKPHVSYYEGKQQIRMIYDDIFGRVGEIRSIFPAERFFENFSVQDYAELDRRMTDHAIQTRDLFVRDRHYRRIKEIRAKRGAEGKKDKRLPAGFTCNTDVLIYGNRVALISFRDLSALVIENADIAEFFRTTHDFLWKHS